MDCGKGNTFHKVHGFVGCFISHSDGFQGAINHIIDDDLFIVFKLHLPKIPRELKAYSGEHGSWTNNFFS